MGADDMKRKKVVSEKLFTITTVVMLTSSQRVNADLSNKPSPPLRWNSWLYVPHQVQHDAEKDSKQRCQIDDEVRKF